MPTSTPSVGIVVVHYTGREDTLKCLASLSRLTYPSAVIYLVDQGAGDGTVAEVRSRFPDVRIRENSENLGYAGGSNIGIRAALDDGARYVFLLNNDVTVAPDTLSRLVEAAEAMPNTGLLGPLMLSANQPDTVWARGGRIDWRGQSSLLREEGKPDFIVGCGMLIRDTVFARVGLFDERFFLYYEEADLGARARDAGFGIVTVPDARLWHRVSGATGTDSLLTLYYMRRNALLYLAKRGQWLGACAAIGDTVRLALVWTLQGKQKEYRRTLTLALRDALRGHWGKASDIYR